MDAGNKMMDFQEATAKRIVDLFFDKSNPRERVLLADEVGLGKTKVAARVVSLFRERIRERRKGEEKDNFRVVYVCSNLNIVDQNLDALGVATRLDFNESRLSMQHYSLEQTLRENTDEILMPLTPSTSFDFRSTGLANERALMCVILLKSRQFEGEAIQNSIKGFFQGTVKDEERWGQLLSHYSEGVDNLGTDYLRRVETALSEYLTKENQCELLSRLGEVANNPTILGAGEKGQIISRLRHAFAKISLDQLNPDLVIMDEFQRFRNLLINEGDDEQQLDEQKLLAKEFFAKKGTRILLLSATPYRPFTTLDELTESGVDEHFDDFQKVVLFLCNGKPERKKAFDETWKRFNTALVKINADTFDKAIAVKKDAEAALYGMMCRTERINEGNIRTVLPQMSLSSEDIRSYFGARELLGAVNNNKDVSEKKVQTVPIEYTKSSSYLMSFMEHYKLKEYIREGINSSKTKLPVSKFLYVPYKLVEEYKQLPATNARLHSLVDMLFSEIDASRLLWVPASRPYYLTHGVFSHASGFSKILVFSSWAMVPRMISCLVSYEAERRVVRGLKGRRRPGGYFNEERKKRSQADRLRFKGEEENPLCHASPYLAAIYKPEEWLGKDVGEILGAIKNIIQPKVEEIAANWRTEGGGKWKIASLSLLMRALDGEAVENHPGAIDDVSKVVDTLALAALGSPAICAYRLTRDMEQANNIAKFFESMFNRPDPSMVVTLCAGRKAENYVEEVLEYCVEGNLQAVLDEYDHMLDGKWKDVLKHGPMDTGTWDVDMKGNKGGIERHKMRTSFAVPFSNTKMDEKTVAGVSALRTAFNSPFRPFVLTTTSVGQEGLDFHWYARKVIHWNLPSNPADMEQREGRVNRYKCLSIRQRLGKYYGNVPSWDEIFKKAKEDFKGGNSDLVPFWCLPQDFDNPDQSPLIERIILMYPLSQDCLRYENKKKVLSLYRLTMGQPRQEELLEMLAKSDISPDNLHELTMNLSPVSRI
ncbi:MAG: helicase [Kiritimatiellae bacterium]|nr:helicase [Kiritimatiellia bacterium]